MGSGFFSTETQPGIAPEPKVVAPSVVLRRRKNLTLPASDGLVAKLGLEKLFAPKGPYKTNAELKAELAKPKEEVPEPEAEAQPGPGPEPEAEPYRPAEVEGPPPVLSKAAPMDNARAFARDRLSRDGTLATYHFHGDWWQWNGRFYEGAPAERISGAVYQYLDRALVRTANGDEPFRPKPEHAEALIKCLKACVAIDDRDVPPAWLLDQRRGPPAEQLLVFKNCLVDAETGEIVGLTPHLWTHGGADFDFDSAARCPRWERFLEELFPGDQESQMTIEEQLGYGATNDVRFEKGALWVGEKRSGKSTLVWVQERLVGAGAYASLSFHDWMKTENSRAHLLGKKVAVFPDVRLKPARAFGMVGYDPGGLDHQSAQLLLQHHRPRHSCDWPEIQRGLARPLVGQGDHHHQRATELAGRRRRLGVTVHHAGFQAELLRPRGREPPGEARGGVAWDCQSLPCCVSQAAAARAVYPAEDRTGARGEDRGQGEPLRSVHARLLGRRP